jgi:ABC-type transport system involved in cytochrome bd biosynthesis fused ATPase/permease subunit
MGTIEINNLSFKYDNMSQNIFNKFDLNIDERDRKIVCVRMKDSLI